MHQFDAVQVVLARLLITQLTNKTEANVIDIKLQYTGEDLHHVS